MSTTFVVTIRCDRCPATFTGNRQPGGDLDRARPGVPTAARAKGAGWTWDGGDLCPTCSGPS